MTPEPPAPNCTTRRIDPPNRRDDPDRDGGGGQVVLVTGGGGFLGTHIVNRLIARGDRVRVLGRRTYPELAELGVDCRQGDIRDEAAVRKALEGVDAVIHAAALPGIWGDHRLYYDINYLGTRHIIDAAIGANARKLVYTSTPSVIHAGKSIDGGDESLPYPKRYVNPYASTKALAEKLVINMNSSDFATAAIRPHLIFGPGDTQLIPKLLDRARAGRLRRVGKGENRVSVSYVENVADAHLMLLDRLEPGRPAAGQIYFINEPEPVNCWDFINRIVVGAGLPKVEKSIPYPVAHAAGRLCELAHSLLGRKTDPVMTRFLAEQLGTSHWFRVDKAGRDLDWRPRVSLDEGVRRTLMDMKENGQGNG